MFLRSRTAWLYTEVTRGVLKRVQQSIWEQKKNKKKNTSYLLYRFTTEEEPEEDQRTARRHASKFCVAHSAHIKGLVRHHALPRRGGAAETAGCPGAAGWLGWLGLASSAMRPVDRQAVPIWPLSGDSPAGFPRSDRWLEGQSLRMQQLASDMPAWANGGVCSCNSACELS